MADGGSDYAVFVDWSVGGLYSAEEAVLCDDVVVALG